MRGLIKVKQKSWKIKSSAAITSNRKVSRSTEPQR